MQANVSVMPIPVLGAEFHQLLRILHGKRAQHHRIEKTEDGRIGADAERQRDESNDVIAGVRSMERSP